MDTKDSHLIFETYKLHAELADSAATSRESLNKVYAGLVTSIIAASVLLHRLVPDSETTWVLPVLGTVVSLSWMFSLHSATGRLRAKHDVLVILEDELPFRFFELESREFEKSRFLRRKHTGLILPCSFLAFCAMWLGFLVMRQLCSP